jgi:MFS family permease
MQTHKQPDLKTILIATGAILTLAMGVRHGFGFWLQPISQAHGWTRETYSLALATQNLLWGVFGPFAGAAVDKFGTAKVVAIGAVLYATGLLWMAVVNQPVLFIAGSSILLGAALACTTFGAVSSIIGRHAPEAKRSWAFGLSAAMSSFGQFIMIPIEQQLITHAGWQNAFYILVWLGVCTNQIGKSALNHTKALWKRCARHLLIAHSGCYLRVISCVDFRLCLLASICLLTLKTKASSIPMWQ